MDVKERFLKYIAINTESDDNATCFPSTLSQKEFLAFLKDELIEIGIKNAVQDENGYVYALIPANKTGLQGIGFLAHVDTSPAVSGNNIKPSIIHNYDGNNINLNKNKSIIMKVDEYPMLKDVIGQDLIVTDGTTLLGADDKAGVAEIMSMAEYIISHPDFKHGDIAIAFTPDEEVGRGVDYFDVDKFPVKLAYTVDGGALGEIEYENFNAASMTLYAHGVSIHPGSAKNMMKNALEILFDFHSLLPVQMKPQYTENYEGFYHLDYLEGKVQDAKAEYIIRDHDIDKFNEKKEYAIKACNIINEKYGAHILDIEIKDQYYNMKEKVLPHFELIEKAENAMKNIGINPKIIPIRGGTDGARLSYKGIITPNLCAGGYNFHGIYEFIPVKSLYKITDMLIEIIKLFAE